ncbi:hypothetical protein E4V42_23140 [Clostridium estertheticum]|uniref:Uncharacterized protein n=1 Tax=Clostridium estertheticum TaxID=238834 RepID=A0A5N7IVG1_9CLOT|nr:hypothetical protein [Clostridium estertheticum]MPQ34283.1 hypothetical protein [Clostridium estertheticum]MPQ64916.1 hypothetical protein [Clostridium estertheticum]
MNKLKITIILYLFPILLTAFITKSSTYFLLSAGIMTILLGLSMRFIPKVIGYKSPNKKESIFLFLIMAGFCLVITASSQI